MTLFLSIIGGTLLLQFLFVWWNLRQFPRLAHVDRKITKPSLSILIPARDEADRIEECLLSIVNQTMLPSEILVLNDNSSDETAYIVKELAKRYPIITLLEGKPLEKGWLGKSYACHQLALAAKSNWYLFLDADVRLERNAMEAISVLTKQEKGMISGFPKQQVDSWLEKIVVPMMMFLVACHLPVKLVRASSDPRFAAAHGGFILIEQKVYNQIGGHSAIRSTLIDDIELARLVKKHGFTFTLAQISEYVSMKMYQNAAEVWSGYRKNIFQGVNRNFFLLFLVFGYYSLLYLVPPIFVVIGIMSESALLYPGIMFMMAGAAIKAIIDRANRLPWYYGFLIPLSICMVIVIGLDSVRIAWSKKGYLWKGRSYT